MRLTRLFYELRRHLLVAFLLSYISACVVFGGASREGHLAHGVLQAIAGIGLAGLVISWPPRRLLGRATPPAAILVGIAVLGLLQCVPTPPAFWQALPARSEIALGFYNLNLEAPMLSVSLDIEETLTTIGYILTPLFVLILGVRIGASSLGAVMPWYMCFVGLVSVSFGLCQVLLGLDSELYLYEFSNRGFPLGFFSNINHQSSLLLVVLPFPFFLFSELMKNWKGSDTEIAVSIVVGAILLAVAVGVFAAGSVAGYCLFVVVVFFSMFATRQRKGTDTKHVPRFPLLIGFVFGGLLVATSPMLEGLGVTSFKDGPDTRLSVWTMTLNAAMDHWVFGTGLGTYESVIPLYEDPISVTSKFVAKAHNDYLQFFMETGLIGVLLISSALIWFVRISYSTWGKNERGTGATLRKIAVVSVLVIVLHSLVDYPVRTPSIAALVAACMALVVAPREPSSERVIDDRILSRKNKAVIL